MTEPRGTGLVDQLSRYGVVLDDAATATPTAAGSGREIVDLTYRRSADLE